MDTGARNGEKNGMSLVPEYALGIQPMLFKDAILPVSDDAFMFCVGSYISVYDISKQRATFPIKTKGHVTCLARFLSAQTFVAVGLKHEAKPDGTKQESATIQVFNMSTGSAKTLSAKFGTGVDLLCFTDAHHLCSFDKNQVIMYWKWDAEKVVGSLEVKLPISRILLHPKSNSLSVSGKSYLRLLELNTDDGYVKESDTFLALKEEKKLHFLDHCWIGSGVYFVTITSQAIYFFKHVDLVDTIILKTLFQDGENNSMRRRLPGDVALLCCTTWAKGFAVAGTHGFLGVFSFQASTGTPECVGTFWLEEPCSIGFISPQAGDAPMAIFCSKEHEDSLFGISSHMQQRGMNWYFYTFPIGECDLLREEVAFHQVFPLGFHQQSISMISGASGRKCFVTYAEDSLKVCTYNPSGQYETEVHYTCDDGYPTCVAMHPSGFQIAIAFSDRVRLYNINRDTLMPSLEIIVKKPSSVCFNHAGDLLGIAAMTSVMIWDHQVPCMINIFGGHLASINRVIFTNDDKLIVSCGADGCVYGWTATSGPILRVFEHVSKGTNYQQVIHDVQEEGIVLLTKEEGLMRIVEKTSGFFVGDVKNACLSCLALCRPTKTLFGGTYNGAIRAYAWPIGLKENAYAEFVMHSSPIRALCTSLDFTRIFSGCSKGTLMCSKLQMAPDSEASSVSVYATRFSVERRSRDVSTAEDAKRQAELEKRLGGVQCSVTASANDFVFIPKEFLKEKLTEIKEMRESMENLRNETDYTLAQKDQEIGERLQVVDNERQRDATAGQKLYDTVSSKLSDAHIEFEKKFTAQALDFEEKMKDIEDNFERRLSKEFEKQSRLLHELQNVHETHEKEMEDTKTKYEAELSTMRNLQEKAMREWRSEYDKVCNLLKTDGLKFEEALRQQEDEYENEIQDLVATKRAALQSENQKSTEAVKDSVSMKNSIYLLQKTMREKDEELKALERKCEELQKKLQHMTEMFQQTQIQMKEREDVITIKDGTIAQLREQQKHLESFRFVLFHKVRALEEERDPLEDQVNSLRTSVQEMYSEVVKELRTKQKLEQGLVERTVKTNSLMHENKQHANRYVQMKKDFNGIYNDVTELTLVDNIADCAKHLRQIIRKFEPKIKALNVDEVKEDNNVSLPFITEEALRQRDILLKKSKNISDANLILQRERAADSRRLVNENCALITELNSLRAEKKSYQKKVKEMELLGRPGEQASSPRSRSVAADADTPYLRRKKGNQEKTYRLQNRRIMNSLPPGAPRMDREYDRPEYVKRPGSLPLNDMPLDMGSDEPYTGGPINPEYSIPKMKPQSSLGRK